MLHHVPPVRTIAMAAVMMIALPAAAAEQLRVTAFSRQTVVTDPAKGVNTYARWSVFPPAGTRYRSMTLSVTYQCPDSLHCGEWDYIDCLYLRRVGHAASPSKDVELARLISPYGWRFTPSWKFTWRVDVTDFAFMLHDSVELEFRHSGYESNADRGWLVTVEFTAIEGRPPMECLGMEKLWEGSFPYGDTLKSIEEFLPPIPVVNRTGAAFARLRILQTGHGMDDQENCAEFCGKYRRVYFDSTLVEEKPIWRECGDNPLSPQAGTWIYDRAGWCPGSMVEPDCYDLPVTPGSRHALNIDMQEYVNHKHPSASYVVSSSLFWYTDRWAGNDATLEEILSPSGDDRYRRLNPVCATPRIRMRNNGRTPLRSVTVAYGLEGGAEQTYRWEGMLAPGASAELSLPGLLTFSEGSHRFRVRLASPNGKKDEYPDDNALSSTAEVPPVYGTECILLVHTNYDSTQNAYRIISRDGRAIVERKLGTLKPNTLYRDTLRLTPGCYELTVDDTAGDGLDFWANPEGGYGYVRLLDLHGKLQHAFLSDFGSGISHAFTTASEAPNRSTDSLPLVNPFPIRNPGKFSVEIFFDEPTDMTLRITGTDGAPVFEERYRAVKETTIPMDISNVPDGFYFLTVTGGELVATRKIKVKHAN